MANLLHVTFTGIDDNTDASWLLGIRTQYPKVEFGMLMAVEPVKRSGRFPDPEGPAARGFYEAARRGLGLSAHLCGSLAKEAAKGEWGAVMEHCPEFSAFSRCQLNIAHVKDVPAAVVTGMPGTLREVIVQQKGAGSCEAFLQIPRKDGYSVLLDASGGHGVYAEPVVLEGPYKVGYAGGLNPDNVRGFLESLLADVRVGDFWIDMESGVRTGDDLFSPGKVEAVIRNIEDLLLC